jgi:hypothetical protein
VKVPGLERIVADPPPAGTRRWGLDQLPAAKRGPCASLTVGTPPSVDLS